MVARTTGPARRDDPVGATSSAPSPSPSTGRGEVDLRERILTATHTLLDTHRFADLSVAAILTEAGVSRASFYFYFPHRQAVLAELARRAVSGGHRAAQPWLGREADPVVALRSGVAEGARLWRENAGVLVAMTDTWTTDADLRTLWLGLMQSFTDATRARIEADPRAMAHLGTTDLGAVAAALTWWGERLYSLAALGVAPFDDETTLVDTLTDVWTRLLYATSHPDEGNIAAR